ncbi:MAG: EscJ/YscJ/HrcJ family type secretion inner rane ring protein [Paucimonas sp.]|nr:EscJ/YscJ/HrcJ family type secretion inner rane ring protein [Paucimonas sp.]
MNTFKLNSRMLARRAQHAASAVLLVTLVAACGGQVELVSDIAEPEGNEVLSALLDANVRATKVAGKEGMVKLMVEQSQVARAISVMRTEGLPRERFAKMGEVFRKEGMISSPLEERARYLWALSQELSATINQIDGVVRARVHVVLPERSSGGDPAMPSSAAVFIKHKRGFNLDESVPQVKRLVSNSIPGLVAERVSVVLLMAGQKPADVAAASNTKVWGVTVPNQSASSLQWMLAALAGMLVVALAAAGALAWRLWGKPVRLPVRLPGKQATPAPATVTGEA